VSFSVDATGLGPMLNTIDELRDEYGAPESEHCHLGIESGQP
jgi:hypothetical protein